METLFEAWGKKNPEWEIKYTDILMEPFTEYGKGTNQYSASRGKIFGAGYEMFIIGFFIGLYFNKTRKLTDDKAKRKKFGNPIMFWGSLDGKTKLGRTSYKKIQEYMFAALIAKTDIDFISLEKGETPLEEVVKTLISKMEQYANYGFHYLAEMREEDPNGLFKESAFLKIFTSFINNNSEEDDDEPESFTEENESTDDIRDIEELQEEVSLQKEQENDDWSEIDIDRLKMFYERDMEIEEIARRTKKSLYSVKFQLARLGYIKMPLNVTVENTSDHCYIKNIAGDIVYEDEGKLKIINDTIYRFNLKPMCLTVKNIIYSNQKWDKGDKMLVAYTESALFPELSSSSFIDDIEDFVEGEKPEKNKIKVKGKWYDFYGDVMP